MGGEGLPVVIVKVSERIDLGNNRMDPPPYGDEGNGATTDEGEDTREKMTEGEGGRERGRRRRIRIIKTSTVIGQLFRTARSEGEVSTRTFRRREATLERGPEVSRRRT
jgi:hypothetical protein